MRFSQTDKIVDKNKNIAKFFKSHAVARELLLQVTKQKYGKAINVVISCVTRWSTDYFMLRKNLRIKAALLAAVVDDTLIRDFRLESNTIIRRTVLDEVFWQDTERVAMLLQPLSTGIRYDLSRTVCSLYITLNKCYISNIMKLTN